jgi:hypothetical protein
VGIGGISRFLYEVINAWLIVRIPNNHEFNRVYRQAIDQCKNMISSKKRFPHFPSERNTIEILKSREWIVFYDETLHDQLKGNELGKINEFVLETAVLKKLADSLSKASTGPPPNYIFSRRNSSSISVKPAKYSSIAIIRTACLRRSADSLNVLLTDLSRAGHGIWRRDDGDTLFYKLDSFEDHKRMRRRLIVNYDYTNHHVASEKRDKSSMFKHAADEDLPNSSRGKMRIQFPGISEELIMFLSSTNEALFDDEIEEEDRWSIVDEEDFNDGEIPAYDRFICGLDCERISPTKTSTGRLELTSRSLSFRDTDGVAISWEVDSIREIQLRRYKLKRTACELFMTDGSSCFLSFENCRTRNRWIRSVMGKNEIVADLRSPMEQFEMSSMTERWVRREVSNFDYLMWLNTGKYCF